MHEIVQDSRTQALPSFELEGRLAVIIGASLGIGQALAVAFARAGARLALVSRSTERLAETVAQVLTAGAEVQAYEADVRAVATLPELAAAVHREQGAPTILVNSAGYPLTKPALAVTEQEWDLVLDTGLKGMYFSCLAFAPLMGEQGYGKIINLSSTYAASTAPGKSVYAITKAGVTQLTRALALEWAEMGIRVNALAPTVTDTPTRQGVLASERMQSILQRIPLGRHAKTEDLLGAALFLASEASDFVTGQTLFVDGGWTVAR